jgi:DNA-binding response OmpR family regulator
MIKGPKICPHCGKPTRQATIGPKRRLHEVGTGRPYHAALINMLRERLGGIVSNDELVGRLWGHRAPLFAKDIVKIYVMELREIGYPITTYWGRGYAFVPTLHEVRADPETEAA